jgi:hypothetical protein
MAIRATINLLRAEALRKGIEVNLCKGTLFLTKGVSLIEIKTMPQTAIPIKIAKDHLRTLIWKRSDILEFPKQLKEINNIPNPANRATMDPRQPLRKSK